VKRTERGEPIGAVTHICTGTTQGNSLRSYLYLKLAKCQVSHFIFYVFSSIKLENRGRNRIGAVGTVGGGGGGERGGRVNMVQTMYTHVCKCKNDTC
jgi:hypothetical protein